MKFEDLKIVQKWREYAGPKDERLEAENAKIYKIGFYLLSWGMLMILFYETFGSSGCVGSQQRQRNTASLCHAV